MSKSDAQRRSYLADQMTMGERVEAIERRLGGLESDVLEVDADDIQYFHDELRSLGRRIADLESSGTTRKASPTECGRIVVDANAWDRLCRLEKRVLEFAKLELHGVTFNNAETWNAWLAVTKELK